MILNSIEVIPTYCTLFVVIVYYGKGYDMDETLLNAERYSQPARLYGALRGVDNNSTIMDAIDVMFNSGRGKSDSLYGRMPKGSLKQMYPYTSSNPSGMNVETLGGQNLVMVEEQDDPITEGLYWKHEDDHEGDEKNRSVLPVDPYFAKHPQFIEAMKNPKVENWINYVGQETEMNARYSELESIHAMRKAGLSDHPAIQKRVGQLSEVFKYFGDTYQDHRGDDYNRTMVNEALRK